mmetsp:Transcript_106250/g.310625  ORF Transcript_106250/g.310625 Transcript_106250/m.310625 type:complete len:271 (+) Transcript_106250:242-1054(+)
MKFRVCSRPSRSTTVPAAPIFCTASPANFTTSPWVFSATVGMFLPTFASLSSVLATSETFTSRPRPQTLMSNLSSNFPNSSMAAHSARFSGVRQQGSKPSLPSFSQCVAAKSVRERKQLPLDHVDAFGTLALILSTVVPLPVPLRPTRTTTQPSPWGSLAMISSATWSAVLPSTSMSSYFGGSMSLGSTPLSMACCTPAASFSPSSSSRLMMPSISFFENSLKLGSSFRHSMMAVDVLSSWAFRMSRVMAAMSSKRGSSGNCKGVKQGGS